MASSKTFSGERFYVRTSSTMRDDYKIVKPTSSISLQIESEVIDILKAMESHKKITVSELANTALRRFISSHKDFMPSDFYDRNPNKLNNQR